MSQRIHSCSNNTNLETIHCDAYTARLIHKNISKGPPKPPQNQQKVLRERSGSTNRTMMSSGRNVRQTNMKLDPFKKDACTDNGTIEMTVRSHKGRQRSRSRPGSKEGSPRKEPWGKILTSNENVSTFHNYDPLRTIHFLAKELQSKLKHSLPYDTGVHHMVVEMQQALNRVPAEMKTTAIIENIEKTLSTARNKREMLPTKLSPESPKKIVKVSMKESSSQTPKNFFVEPEKLQQHLEESSEKIEKACKQMEMLCSKLKSEKEELEGLLCMEKETVRMNQKQLEEYRIKQSTANALIQNLQMKNEEQQLEINKLKIQIESQQGPTTEELKKFVQDLQRQKIAAENETMLLKQQLTLASMESEKYDAILKARDAQVKEIRKEMSELQEVVNEQLMQLQNNTYSDVSSYTNLTGSSTWPAKMEKMNELGNNTMSSVNSVESANELYSSPKHQQQPIQFKELQSGDTESDLTEIKSERLDEKEKGKKINKKRHEKISAQCLVAPNVSMNFREKFAKIKKEAFSYNLGK